MPTIKKIYADVLRGQSDHNLRFSDLKRLLDALGFKCSVRGNHFIYRRDDTPIINIQPENGKAKAYQVRQIREIIISVGLEV